MTFNHSSPARSAAKSTALWLRFLVAIAALGTLHPGSKQVEDATNREDQVKRLIGQVATHLEVGRRLGLGPIPRMRGLNHGGGIEGVGTVGPLGQPVQDRSPILLADVGDFAGLGQQLLDPLGKLIRDRGRGIAGLDRGALGRADQGARLVDPHRHGDVVEAEELVGHMRAVDQGRMRRRGRLDPGSGLLR